MGMATVTLLQSLFSGRVDFFHVALANIFFNGKMNNFDTIFI